MCFDQLSEKELSFNYKCQTDLIGEDNSLKCNVVTFNVDSYWKQKGIETCYFQGRNRTESHHREFIYNILFFLEKSDRRSVFLHKLLSK